MRPRRVLMIDNFQRRARLARWYETAFALRAGLIRAGHAVFDFSERDTAVESTVFRSKAPGRRKMIAALRQTVEWLRPELMLFGHADLIDDEDLQALRAAAPDCAFAQVNVDSPHRTATMAKFAARARRMDASFITSAPPKAEIIGFPAESALYFWPNPVDPSVHDGRAFDTPRPELARDGGFAGGRCEDRPAQIAALRAALPADFRFEGHGMACGAPNLEGARYMRFLAGAGMAPSLQPDSARAEPRLYASNRVAQQMGQGVLTLCHRSAGLDALYGEGVASYGDIAHLAELMAGFAADDSLRRRTARAGWEFARRETDSSRVAAYVVETVFSEPTEGRYGWPTTPLR